MPQFICLCNGEIGLDALLLKGPALCLLGLHGLVQLAGEFVDALEVVPVIL